MLKNRTECKERKASFSNWSSLYPQISCRSLPTCSPLLPPLGGAVCQLLSLTPAHDDMHYILYISMTQLLASDAKLGAYSTGLLKIKLKWHPIAFRSLFCTGAINLLITQNPPPHTHTQPSPSLSSQPLGPWRAIGLEDACRDSLT